MENYSGYKLSKYEKGELKNNFLLNESIETLNKKFTEELIEINKIPLRFNNKLNYQNEIDLNENFQILSNLCIGENSNSFIFLIFKLSFFIILESLFEKRFLLLLLLEI